MKKETKETQAASTLFRGSHRMYSVRKGVLRNFAKLTGKDLCQRLFFIKLEAQGLQLYLKRGPDTGVFLLISQISLGSFFYKIPSDDCFRLLTDTNLKNLY